MAISREQIHQVAASLTERLGLRSVLGDELGTHRPKLPRVARSDAPVLLSGVHGAEAERVARAVHYLSPRAGSAFIAIPCGSLSEAALLRTLFGPEETLADLFESMGTMRRASGGTLFLDEVEHLGATAQTRLLRCLRGRTPEDVRFICATHTDLRLLVEQGHFRADLYYRINVISLTLLSSVPEK